MSDDYRTQRFCLIAAGALGAIAVALGAFHAHGLEAYLEKTGMAPELVSKRMENCAAGVRYQMYGAITLLATGALSATSRVSLGIPIGFVVGTILFAGSLYGIVFLNKTWLGAVAPLGGGTLIGTWFWLAISAARSFKSESNG